MKSYKILLLIPVMFYGCTEELPSFGYDFRIARTTYLNNNWSDSSVFYYDNAMHLLREDRCYGKEACARQTVYYNENTIVNSQLSYLLDNNQRVISRENTGNITKYFYENDLISRLERDFSDEQEEHYFFYEQEDLTRDSTVLLLPGQSSQKVTVYEHEYGSLIRPAFMIHISGLFEFPHRSIHLPTSSVSKELGICVKFEYEFTENTMIQHAQSVDLFNNQDIILFSNIYYLLDEM